MGMLKGKSDNFDATQEETFDLPKRWKRVTVGIVNGERKVGFSLSIDGRFYEWEEVGEVRQTKNETGAKPYFGVLALLVDLTEENVKLSPLANKEINNQPSVGFRAAWDRGTGDYYFDKRTGLLVQTNFKWQPEPGKEFESKVVFGDYKEVDGVKLPHRRTSYIYGKDAKDLVFMDDFNVTEVRILDTIPNDVFSLPKKK
jgi:hypothetical protein